MKVTATNIHACTVTVSLTCELIRPALKGPDVISQESWGEKKQLDKPRK